MRGWTDGRRQEGGRAPGTRRRRRWTATTTGFEIGHERAFISSPAFQPTYARPRPEQPKPISSPVRTDDSYKMNRRGRNRTRKVSHNWPFLLEQGAHVGALQAPSTSSFSGFPSSFSFSSCPSQSVGPISQYRSSPPPPCYFRRRLPLLFLPRLLGRKSDWAPRIVVDHAFLDVGSSTLSQSVARSSQHFKWDVYDTSAKCLPVKMAWAMHMIHTRICPFIEDSTQGRR